MADRVGRFTENLVKSKGHESIMIDPAAYTLPLFNKKLANYGKDPAPVELVEISGKLKSADAFIVCSAEYNHSIPPALSNLTSFFWEEYAGKKTICYCLLQHGPVWRSKSSYGLSTNAGRSSIPTILPIPVVHEALDADGGTRNTIITKTADKFFAELVWYTNALKQARQRGMFLANQ